jgi:hypothetical protein
VSKITKEHIKIFRQYFLSHNEEIRRNIRHLIPGIFLKYLSILEDDFMRSPDIENIANHIESSDLLPDLKQLQLDYYISLADIYYKGQTNQEIEQLLVNDNTLFREVLFKYENLNFETELRKAFILSEREYLKNKFQELDKESEISPTEISLAFRLIEREKLKKQFKMLDPKYKLASAMVYASDEYASIAEPNVVYSDSKRNKIVSKRIDWRRYVIAACIIGLIVLVIILIILR